MATKVFLDEYEGLEKLFRRQVEVDNSEHGCESIYLPNVAPYSSADFIFVAMEPSLGPWARSLEEAREKISNGFRNFAGDHLLHFCIRNYLCKRGEAYHLTDISKGAMLVSDAGANRNERYDRWHSLLLAELEIVGGPDTKIISIGRAAGDFLTLKGVEGHVGTILHYSGQATSHRNRAVVGREQEFREFTKTLTQRHIDRKAESALNVSLNLPSEFSPIHANRADLSASKMKLMFTYKIAFDELLISGEIS